MDVAGKVFGTTPWTGDIRVDGMVHGRMVRPPVAGASVVSVDESSVAHIPGAQVVRKGDFIGVVAPKEWNAIKAAQALRVTWSDAKEPFVECRLCTTTSATQPRPIAAETIAAKSMPRSRARRAS